MRKDFTEDQREELGKILVNRTIRVANGCLEWQGATARGYGHFKLYQKDWVASRAAWVVAYGWLKDCVLHKCDNRLCCDWEHLFYGTYKVNRWDAVMKGRARGRNSGRTHCWRGHDLNLASKDINGRRHCMICQNIWRRNKQRKAI